MEKQQHMHNNFPFILNCALPNVQPPVSKHWMPLLLLQKNCFSITVVPDKILTFSFEFSTTACVWGILTTRCFDVSWIGRPTRDGKLRFKVDSSAMSRAAVWNTTDKITAPADFNYKIKLANTTCCFCLTSIFLGNNPHLGQIPRENIWALWKQYLGQMSFLLPT